MKKFIFLFALLLGTSVILFSQTQFANPDFEESLCTTGDCTIGDGLFDCIPNWWNWHPGLNGINGPLALFDFNCIPFNACEGRRSLKLGGGVASAPTTNNPLKDEYGSFYAINFDYMRLPNIIDPESSTQITILGTIHEFSPGQTGQAEILSLSEAIPAGNHYQCVNTTLPLAGNVVDYDYLLIDGPYSPNEEPPGRSTVLGEYNLTVDNLSLCSFLDFTKQEKCSTDNEACFFIDYNSYCLNLSCPEATNDLSTLYFRIIQDGVSGDISTVDVLVSDLPTEVCFALPSSGTYTLDMFTEADASCPDIPELSGYQFDFNYENPCAESSIFSSQTWTTNNTGENGYLITGNIIVEYGVTLTIEEGVTLAFCEGSGLIIKDNARVNLYGTLTSCDEKWRGVQVYGSANAFTQSNLFGTRAVGSFYTYETALIEKAIHTVDLFGPTAEHAGGVMYAEASTFKNFYQSGIRIKPFENHDPILTNTIISYEARFTECKFIMEDGFSPELFWKMASLDGVRGVRFYGCDFDNQQVQTNLPFNYYGLGIHAINSSFSADYHCATIVPVGDPCPDYTRNTFTGFTVGISLNNIMTEDKGYSIKESEFRHCGTGIYSFASSYGIITHNDFYLGHSRLFEGFDIPQVGTRFYGEQTGFFFEENNFQLDEPGTINTSNTIGSLCRDIGETNNYVRLNNYTGLRYGNLSNGKNYEDENIGLVYLCNTNANDNTEDGSDFAVTDEGIRARQAFIKINEFGFYEYNPAGNHFSHTAVNSYSDFNNEGGNLTYYYSTHASSTIDELPVSYSMTTINLEDRNKEGECEIRDAPGIIIDINDRFTKFATHKTAWQMAKSNYLALLDGGDTEALLQQIATAIPGDVALYNDLMAYSPYLSPQVTEALTNTAVFTGNNLFNVLDANPGITYSEGFYDNLLTGNTGLDFTQVLSLQNNQTISNSRTELELDIAYHRQEMDYNANLIISTTLDAEEIEGVDFVNNWYAAIENKSGDYKTVESLIQKELYADAQNLLANMPATYKLSGDALTVHNEYVALINLMTTIHQAGYQPKDIPTAMLEDLYAIYETATGIAKYKAAALYAAATDKLFLEYSLPSSGTFIFLSEEQGDTNKTSLQNNVKKRQYIVSNVSVYPNPAKNVVYLKNIKNATQLKITDITGRIVLQTDIKDSIYQWETNTISNGIYFYTLYTDKTSIDTGKIVIDK